MTTADQQRALDTYVKLMRCANAVTTRLHRHLRVDGLSVTQFGVLEALLHLGPMRMQDLSRKVLKSGGNLTLVVGNLEKRGLVRRQVGPLDRRVIEVTLTADGRHLVRNVFKRHAAEAVDLFSAIAPTEQTHLGHLLKRLGTAASAAPGDYLNDDNRVAPGTSEVGRGNAQEAT